ncbi:MAG TPA: PQQ-binding-like beta-propeller repeat protein [Marmoricola sp.]|nr:PQQ-binding-like beta-propeller repeat protein [Marmoricola sp.]
MTDPQPAFDVAEAARIRSERRSWLPIAIVIAAIVVGLVVIVATRPASLDCATRSAGSSPLLSATGMKDQPDPRLDKLAAVVDSWGAPFGQVEAGVGYDYGQYLHLFGLDHGVLALTKNNAALTLLDPSTLKARWALIPATKRTAWDASAKQFALLDLDSKKRTRLATFDLATGKQHWCIDLNSQQKAGQPVSTDFLSDGDLLVALPFDGELQLARVDGDDGRVLWSVRAKDAGRADFIGALNGTTAIVGGVEEYRLASAPTTSSSTPVVTAYTVKSGKQAWTWGPGADATAHIVGLSGGRIIVETRSATGRELVALSGTGHQLWKVALAPDAAEATVRGDVVLSARTSGLAAYDAATGKPVWHQAFPPKATYFPYGFTLDEMPSLDADHLLMATTTALVVLDVRTGAETAYALPTDGVNTTYWPYQLVATDKLFGVVTNTGGVLASRTVGDLR